MSDVAALAREARDGLEAACGQKPADTTWTVDMSERAVVRVRDALIEGLRAGDLSVRETLDLANTALSLIAGVEYPVGGIQRKVIEDARDVMRRLCAVAERTAATRS